MAADHAAILDGVFGAAEAGDWERFRSFFDSEAVMAQNIGQPTTLDESLDGIRALFVDGTTLRYENARRVVGDRGATEMHDAVFTKPDGREVRLDICVVIQFNDDGLIVRTDEYLDSAAAASLLA